MDEYSPDQLAAFEFMKTCSKHGQTPLPRHSEITNLIAVTRKASFRLGYETCREDAAQAMEVIITREDSSRAVAGLIRSLPAPEAK